MNFHPQVRYLIGAAIVAMAASGCGGSQSSMPTAPPASTAMQRQLPNGASPADGHSILKQLTNQVVIGSTIDPVHGQLNPYGLDVAKSTAGAFTKGDLAVCNFNNSANVQGTGYTIVALHPAPGSSPTLVAADTTTLVGCDALALAPDDTMWAAAFSSNDNPVFSSTGTLITNLSGSPFNNPFGQTYAQSMNGHAAVYESNAADGSVVRIDPRSKHAVVIATGFPVNGGPPGSILGPSGLQYDARHDSLFVVDGQNNSVTELRKVSAMQDGCLRVKPRSTGLQFDGACKANARVIISGAPLNGPISSALLFNGHLVIGNTLDSSGENLMIEIDQAGKVLDVRNVDTGAGGALFGMVATGTNAANTKIYFNDDNANNLQVLER
jgi:hypothetical protein